jgi:hypothetical protein
VSDSPRHREKKSGTTWRQIGYTFGIIFWLFQENTKMKKEKKVKPEVKTVQTDKDVKNLPAKNSTSNTIRNTASQTPGLNQANTTRDDLFPSDGDNLTS